MSNTHILDPLWITKGNHGLDPEYSKYILLAANKKYRKNLDEGDTSSFYEILFHSLNLNNLAVEGSMFNFNMTPVWDDPRLLEIRDQLRKLYQLPEDLVEIFKNANFLLTGLLLDYLEIMLDLTDQTKSYFVNHAIHREKEIFIVLNIEGSMSYDIWKLRADRRFKFGHKVVRIKTIKLNDLKENALHEAIELDGDPQLQNMDPDTNVLFTVMQDPLDTDKLASAVGSSLVFSRGITKGVRYEPNILSELYDLLSKERVLPFTMKSLI
jgi:hypothetical protein